MRTGDIVDLTSERRLSAELDFGAHGADLLILNGGSRAEEMAVEVTFAKPGLRTRRAMYCVDAGTSMQLVFPFLQDETAAEFTVRLIAGAQSIVLAPPARRPVTQLPAARGGLAAAAAVVFFIVGGSWLDTARLQANPNISVASIQAAAHATPPIVAAGDVPHVVLSQAPAPPRRIAPKAVVAMAPAVPRVMMRARHAVRIVSPRPIISDLVVPMSATSGDTVSVAFHSDAKRVRIVATIGPTVVSRTTVTSHNAVVGIKSPKSDRDGRIMMVRAYAESGDRMSSQEAMVVLAPTPG
jgi:hypothetical protein